MEIQELKAQISPMERLFQSTYESGVRECTFNMIHDGAYDHPLAKALIVFGMVQTMRYLAGEGVPIVEALLKEAQVIKELGKIRQEGADLLVATFKPSHLAVPD